jgi:hypothetical protein
MRSFVICTPPRILFLLSKSRNDVGGAYGTYGGEERYVQGFLRCGEWIDPPWNRENWRDLRDVVMSFRVP